MGHHAVRMSGTTGTLLRGYLPVAQLGAWDLSGDGAFTCHELFEVNEALIDSPAPLGLDLQVGKARWKWEDVQASCLRPVRAVVTGRPVVTKG